MEESALYPSQQNTLTHCWVIAGPVSQTRTSINSPLAQCFACFIYLLILSQSYTAQCRMNDCPRCMTSGQHHTNIGPTSHASRVCSQCWCIACQLYLRRRPSIESTWGQRFVFHKSAIWRLLAATYFPLVRSFPGTRGVLGQLFPSLLSQPYYMY